MSINRRPWKKGLRLNCGGFTNVETLLNLKPVAVAATKKKLGSNEHSMVEANQPKAILSAKNVAIRKNFRISHRFS